MKYVSLKFLIVDDSVFMRKKLRNILEKDNHEVVGEAGNGKEAVTQYVKLRPDIVTMDRTMPDMDGISAVREIIKIDSNAKIIMCSAMGQQSMIVEAIKVGAKDFVIKPFQEEMVLGTIKNICGKLNVE
jgi:two-component system, chemotaxis family, chemotaxis protein CheY